MTQNKKPNFLSRLYNRYSLLIIIILVTAMFGGEFSINLTGVSLLVWLTLMLMRPVIRHYSQAPGQPSSSNDDMFKHLVNLILLGVAITFVAYLIFLHYNNW
jgi:hypothetical protein